jgi:hypothetical protein
MPLINLKTELKSLKYGKDTPGGGNSGQPYIKTDINNVDKSFNQLRLTKFDDGLIRGGAVGAINASVVDTLRIGKFLTDFPKGPLFIVKQVGLQLSNPKIETKPIPSLFGGTTTGIGGLINKGIGFLNKNNIGPTRIYNLGLNTIAQIPVNAFGQHFNRHGFTPVQDENTKYFSVITDNNKGKDAPNNRLVKLKNTLIGNKISDEELKANIQENQIQKQNRKALKLQTSRKVFKSLPPFTKLPENQLNIDDYIGGPGSIYGIGRTLIKRYDFTGIKNQNKIPFSEEENINNKIDLSNYSNLKSRDNETPSDYIISTKDVLDNNNEIEKALSQNVITYKSPDIKKYQEIKNAIENQRISGSNFSQTKFISHVSNPDNIKSGNNSPINYYNISKVSKYYGDDTLGSGNIDKDNPTNTPNIPNVINYGNAYITGKMVDPTAGYNIIKEFNEELKTNSNIRDYKFESKDLKIDRGDKDFKYNGDNLKNAFNRIDSSILQVVFKIITANNTEGNRINLSAYMNGFKDSFEASWNETNYVGRSDSFYIYNKGKRNVSFNLQIPCFNRTQLLEKHRALGQLASTTAGTYNNNFLQGVIFQLNVGNYLVGEYAILNNISYSIPENATWDIDEKLATYIEASFSFTIIHQDLPQYQPNEGFFRYLRNPILGYLDSGYNTQDEANKVAENFNISLNQEKQIQKEKLEFENREKLLQTKTSLLTNIETNRRRETPDTNIVIPNP